MPGKKTDSEIEQWVLRELGLQENLSSQEICVHSLERQVTLRGSVPHEADKLAAAQAAQRVAGIAGVVNEIKIEPRWAEMKAMSIETDQQLPQTSPVIPAPAPLYPSGIISAPIRHVAAKKRAVQHTPRRGLENNRP